MAEATPESKYDLFIEMLGQVGVPNRACELADISRATVFKHKKNDESFAARWEDARVQAVEVLEAEARRRAYDGIDKPYMYKGKVVMVLKERSDRMLEFLLMGWAPKVYGKQQTAKMELTGADGTPLIPEQVGDIEIARRVAFLLTQSVEQGRKQIEETPVEVNPA